MYVQVPDPPASHVEAGEPALLAAAAAAAATSAAEWWWP